MPRIKLNTLTVFNGDVPPAKVKFSSGLNLIIGASDTGKTFIFEAIDFMLGAKGELRRIPESVKYNWVSLSIDLNSELSITLKRAFKGGDIELHENYEGRENPSTIAKILSSVHSMDVRESLSAYLLDATGLFGHQVRKNSKGVKQALSFRDVCHLTLIDEERIIKQASPILTGQYITQTAEKNVFSFFLTGEDDNNIITLEGNVQKNARLKAEEEIVTAILVDKKAELAKLSSDTSDLAAQEVRLETAIKEATTTMVTSQEEISNLENNRANLFEEQTIMRSRLIFLEEQLKRLQLLDEYYQTDSARIQTIIEAYRAFHELPEGNCPLCNHPYTAMDPNLSLHNNLESACCQELNKINILKKDLGASICDFINEKDDLYKRLAEIGVKLEQINEILQKVLKPATQTVQIELQKLVHTRTIVAQVSTLQNIISDLEKRLASIQKAKKEKIVKITFENRATTSRASEFCQVVKEILVAWKYPELRDVTFDTEKTDLVINGQDRANKGKGYRALTYAAFVIGLMKYCRIKDIPHPGFIVLDTPINPLKGPVSESQDDSLSDEMKLAFYEYLANDTSGDQYIIIENVEPPKTIQDRVNYYYFTKRHDIGRYGFFPINHA
jgi:hypothetical protein